MRFSPSGRSAVLGPLLFVALAGPLGAAAVLTEADALRLGLAQGAFQDLSAGRLERAEGAVTGAAQPPRPVLEYAREENPGDATEHSLWLTQEVSLSGRRDLARQAAEGHLTAAGMENAAQGAERAAEIRLRFFAALHRQELARALDAWEGRLAAVEESARRRERAGDVSGYDRLRITRERLLIQARAGAAQGELAAARASLLALIDGPEAGPGDGELAGELLPPEPPPLATLLDRLSARPDLARLRETARAHGLEARAAERAAVPDLTLGLGAKHLASGPGEGTGLLLSVSVPLPVSDPAAGERRRAAAEGRMAEGEHRLALAEARGRVHGLWQQLGSALETARRYRAEATAASEELVRIAEVAYRNGEIGVLELVDAYRGGLDADTQALDLAHEARRIGIELDLAAGLGGDER